VLCGRGSSAAACRNDANAPTQPSTPASTQANAVTGSVVTLVVANAVSTRGIDTNDCDVATDGAVASVVGTKTGIGDAPRQLTGVKHLFYTDV
jgi:hypothetical protein